MQHNVRPAAESKFRRQLPRLQASVEQEVMQRLEKVENCKVFSTPIGSARLEPHPRRSLGCWRTWLRPCGSGAAGEPQARKMAQAAQRSACRQGLSGSTTRKHWHSPSDLILQQSLVSTFPCFLWALTAEPVRGGLLGCDSIRSSCGPPEADGFRAWHRHDGQATI